MKKKNAFDKYFAPIFLVLGGYAVGLMSYPAFNQAKHTEPISPNQTLEARTTPTAAPIHKLSKVASTIKETNRKYTVELISFMKKYHCSERDGERNCGIIFDGGLGVFLTKSDDVIYTNGTSSLVDLSKNGYGDIDITDEKVVYDKTKQHPAYGDLLSTHGGNIKRTLSLMQSAQQLKDAENELAKLLGKE